MAYELRSEIAQHLLAQLGFYTGKLDGVWGPKSIAAAKAWQDAEVLAAIPPAPGSTPYDLARNHIGEKEIPGSKHNALIVRWLRIVESWVSNDETAWCSAFVNAMAKEAGYEHSGRLNARSWMNIGTKVHPADVKPGDVVVFWRVAKDSWEGHVGFVVFRDKNRRTVKVLGGNQNDSVSVAEFDEERLLGYRRLRPIPATQSTPTKLD